MTSVLLNDKPYKHASCYEELKVRHYVRMLKEWGSDGSDIADRDYFQLLGILTDSNFSAMEQTLENQVTLTSLLGWVITQPFKFNSELPKALELCGKKVTIPQDPRELSIGQNIHLRRDFIDKSTILEENISIATAIYLQPIIDNSLFNIARAKEIAKEIDEMPISVIYPIGFFLLERALKFGQKPEKTWPVLKISLKETLRNLFLKWRRSTALTASTISHSSTSTRRNSG